MSHEKILVIEDDIKITRFLDLELKHEGYLVEQAMDGRSGLEKAENEQFDLILLDVMLPSLNGMEVLRRLRQSSETPVIMLTAKDDITDKVMGLDIGADDYVTKPYSIEELLARIRTVLKRKRVSDKKEAVISINGLTIDHAKHSAHYHNELIELTKKEYDLLVFFMENKNIVLGRDKILDKVWGYDFFGDTKVVDVYVRYLRSKIDEKYNTKFIHSIRGVGYVLRDE